MTATTIGTLTWLRALTLAIFPIFFTPLSSLAENDVVEVWVASDCGPCAPWKNKVKELTGASGVGVHEINDGTKTYRIHWMSTYNTTAAQGGSPTGSYPSMQFPGGDAWTAGPVKPLDPEEAKRRAEAEARLKAEKIRAESDRIRKLAQSEQGWTPTKTRTGTTTGIAGFVFPKGTVAYRSDNGKYLVKDANGKITGSDGVVYFDPVAEAAANTARAEAAGSHGEQVAGEQRSRAIAPPKAGLDLLTAFQQFNNEPNKDDTDAFAKRKAQLEALSEEVLKALYDNNPTAEQLVLKNQVVADSYVCEASGKCRLTLNAVDGTASQYKVELHKKEGRVEIEELTAGARPLNLKGLFPKKK